MRAIAIFCTSLALSFFCSILFPDACAGRRQTRMIEASAHNPITKLSQDNEVVDRKQIDLYEGQTYISHSVEVISANPKDAGAKRWKLSDGRIEGEDGRVEAVWVEVRAGNKDVLGDAIWIRAMLTVIVEEQDESFMK